MNERGIRFFVVILPNFKNQSAARNFM